MVGRTAWPAGRSRKYCLFVVVESTISFSFFVIVCLFLCTGGRILSCVVYFGGEAGTESPQCFGVVAQKGERNRSIDQSLRQNFCPIFFVAVLK